MKISININTQEQVAAPICGFDGIRKGNYIGGKPILRAEKLKHRKATGKDVVTREMIKGGSDRMVDWIWIWMVECEVHIDKVHLKHASEFKYLGCVLDESGTDRAGYSRKAANAIRSLVNVW